MSNRIPSRKERLKRAHEAAERLQGQYFNAEDVYQDVRDVVGDPTIDDFQLPEAIERRSAETLKLEEEQREWQKEIRRVKESGLVFDQMIEQLEENMKSSQLSDDDPDEIAQKQLQTLKRVLESNPKVAMLLFKDETLFQSAYQGMKQSGKELFSKLHYLFEESNQIRGSIQDASRDYQERLNDLIKLLENDLMEMQDNLDSAEALQSTTNAELLNTKAEISELKNDAAAASREIDNYQAEIKHLKAKEAILGYMAIEMETVTSDNVRAKAQIVQLEKAIEQQHDQQRAQIRAMNEANNSLSRRNNDQEAEIKLMQDTLKEIEESLSEENNQLELQAQTLDAEKNALSSQNGQYQSQISGLEAEKIDYISQISQYQAAIRNLEADKADLTRHNEEYQERIGVLEGEKADLSNRNEVYQHQIESLNDQYQERIGVLEGEQADLSNRNEVYQHQIESLNDQNSALEEAKANLIGRNEEDQRQIQDLIRTNQFELDRLGTANTNLEEQIDALRLENRKLTSQIEDQLERERQLHWVLFSNIQSLQSGIDGSLPAADTTLFFKQEPMTSHISVNWIKEPLSDTLDQLTNSGLVKLYQLALKGLGHLHATREFPDSLLNRLIGCQKWLVTACKERRSILGLALDAAVKTMEQGPQSEPWFSTSQFDTTRMIDSRNSDLPGGSCIIADGFAGVVLVVQGADVRVLEAGDVLIKQQDCSGFQLVFTGVDVPALQLLPNSWPGYSRWSTLCSWALDIGRVNVVMKDGVVYEPPAL
ncbi:hypothetical protein JMJ35_006947 [Cladonia borealis]|uniref:Uncharacterized protein n=1 Tax=Cladonia borealis TaxID=184061 RepID=A0AA39QYM2_9LECA|nr:hypothetical protein JMJ35_006947 [Cladonia borealis]